MHAGEAIRAGRTALGIELGSTRIKACLVDLDDPLTVLATGGYTWENRLENGLWTYGLDDVWHGVQAAYAELVAEVQRRHGILPTTFGAIGVSGMMHGYLAFDAAGELLAPFRTWRNTNAHDAAAELTDALGVRIPGRWSVAQLHASVRAGEPHVSKIASLTTLSGYVHWRLTGERVLGAGDAAGMFPLDAVAGGFDADLLASYDGLVGAALAAPLGDLLPAVLRAGQSAGELSAEGAALLDPTGALRPGIPFCPPEGDAATGMVATDAVAPRTGNVSVGTSVFAMVVLDGPLDDASGQLDLVATPAGDPVVMVHTNNGAGELAAWAAVFERFARLIGADADSERVFEVLFREALGGASDAGGVLAFTQHAAEPSLGLTGGGRPMVVRSPGSDLTLGTLVRAQLSGLFAPLALGMDALEREGVSLDRVVAHGGVFRTAGAAQRLLAAALRVPVGVGGTAAEGGAWGAAALACFLRRGGGIPLSRYLERVFASAAVDVVRPDPEDIAGFAAYLARYHAALPVEAAAVEFLPG